MKKILLVLCSCALALGALAQSEPAADDLWRQIQLALRHGPAQRGDTAAEQKQATETFLAETTGLAATFIQRYPADPRVWEIKLHWMQLDAELAHLRGQPLNVKVKASRAGVQEIVASPVAVQPLKAQASFFLLEMLSATVEAGQLEQFEYELADFGTKYPAAAEVRYLPMVRLEAYDRVAPAKAEALLMSLTNAADPELAREARRRLTEREFKKKTLDLKFTAVDGTEFDLAKWRGRVVLVDFWATWCGPCRRALPNVLHTYQKLHEKGFEIVGVSLDKDKSRLLATTHEAGMTWPQYFDGKMWDNGVSSRFHIEGIPAMWLVDKKGFLRNTAAGEDLEAEVIKLLAE